MLLLLFYEHWHLAWEHLCNFAALCCNFLRGLCPFNSLPFLFLSTSLSPALSFLPPRCLPLCDSCTVWPLYWCDVRVTNHAWRQAEITTSCSGCLALFFTLICLFPLCICNAGLPLSWQGHWEYSQWQRTQRHEKMGSNPNMGNWQQARAHTMRWVFDNKHGGDRYVWFPTTNTQAIIFKKAWLVLTCHKHLWSFEQLLCRMLNSVCY